MCITLVLWGVPGKGSKNVVYDTMRGLLRYLTYEIPSAL